MPRTPYPSWCDGLCSLHPDEFPKLDALLSEVFRPGMVAEYPHIYTADDTANLRGGVEGGEGCGAYRHDKTRRVDYGLHGQGCVVKGCCVSS